jgi:hypothetical protein
MHNAGCLINLLILKMIVPGHERHVSERGLEERKAYSRDELLSTKKAETSAGR